MVDLNGVIAGLLYDLAIVQDAPQKRKAYERAAAAVRNLDDPVNVHVQPDGSLARIPFIGPSSARIVLEAVLTGASPTVEQAVARSPRREALEKSRGLRAGFLTRSQVLAALRMRAAGAVSLADYRGDFQMHSVWSDGTQTLEDIIEGCLARGYQYSAVTDHGQGLPIARGLSAERLAEQHQEIDRLNERYHGRFRLLKGLEANIDVDGTLDMTPDERRPLEIVVAAPHAGLRTGDDQTDRLLRVVGTPGVHILGHPRGRKYGVRPGLSADWSRVFRAAAASRVAVEIDGDPSRQDIDHELARTALRAGCLFALDSDAHATSELRNAESAVAHARLARIPADRIVNCWPLARLLAWSRAAWRRKPAG